MVWLRERMVGIRSEASAVIKMKWVPGGGSSITLRHALAVWAFMRSAPSMMIKRAALIMRRLKKVKISRAASTLI